MVTAKGQKHKRTIDGKKLNKFKTRNTEGIMVQLKKKQQQQQNKKQTNKKNKNKTKQKQNKTINTLQNS